MKRILNSRMELLEKTIFDQIQNNNICAFKMLMSQDEINPNIIDSHGTSALQMAAYKGNEDIVEILLNLGADINSNQLGGNGYSALHYAVLSDDIMVCLQLLNAGANSHSKNFYGLTTAEMAADIKNHACAAVINNYIPKSELEYFAVPFDTNTKQLLPEQLVDPLQTFINRLNMNPVRIAINVLNEPLLGSNLNVIHNTLNAMRDREIKKGTPRNEILAIKLHCFGYVVGELTRYTRIANKGETGNISERIVKTFATKMLKRFYTKSNRPEAMESFLKKCIIEFPYHFSEVFLKIVSTFQMQNAPAVLSVICAAINGKRFLKGTNTTYCTTCDEMDVTLTCSNCRSVYYCDERCQKYHWRMHKYVCQEPIGTNMKDSCVSMTQVGSRPS